MSRSYGQKRCSRRNCLLCTKKFGLMKKYKYIPYDDKSGDGDTGKCDVCKDIGGFCHVCGTGDINDD